MSEAVEEQGLSSYLTFKMADDIYAWTIDFSRLQKGDKFKLIYEQLYINDTIPVGIGEVKASYFEHGGKPFYAFKFVADSTLNISDYFDDELERRMKRTENNKRNIIENDIGKIIPAPIP